MIQHLYTFFVYVENDRRFPFSLVLSISYLDHFRGISSRRSPSISPLLVNEKVVDHFFEIDDKKRKRRRGGKEERRIDKWSENSHGSFYLETRFVIISTSFSSRLVAQFNASISAGKKSWEDLSSLQYFKYRCPVSRSWKEGAKKWRTSGTIDFSLLNFVFVETLVKVETSFSKLIYLPSSCRLFLNDFEKLC